VRTGLRGKRRGGRAVETGTALLAGFALVAACTQTVPDADPPAEQGGSTAEPPGEQGGSTAEPPGEQGGSTAEPPGEQGGSTAEPSEPSGGGETVPAPEGLDAFYDQDLEWSECEDFECAQLTVPIDYQEPSGDTIQLEVLRVPASGERQGSLVINPGGPGASGVEYAKVAGMVISGGVREQYDVVGFDPRGVAGSAPIECVDDSAMDELLGADPTPDDDAEQAEVDDLLQGFAEACGENAGPLLGHVSTVEAARDIDILRAALGESELDYLGASYGTFLGSTYAELFPEQVGRMVLDGAVAPTLSGRELGLGQAEGFERATRAYVEDCVADGDCPLGDDVDSGLVRIQDFLTELDQDPLPVDGDSVTELSEGWGMLGIIVAMYDQAGWPILTTALEQAFDGDGSMLMFLANLYADRTSDGTYNGNGMQAIYAVNCLDRPGGEEDVDQEEVRRQFEEVSPTWGKYLAGEGACQYWPVEAQSTPEDYDAAGAAPIVVIGTTRDPATPYEWAEILADTLESGVLISYDGDGHTAYGRSNSCVDDAVDAYLLEGTVPEDGLSC
jgi:pimeloyl-ACP methyl ester carboxylesterase